MDKRKLSDNATAIIVAVLMLLTAYGNAWVMLLVAGLLLLGMFARYRDDVREGALPAIAAAVIALVIALGTILFLHR